VRGEESWPEVGDDMWGPAIREKGGSDAWARRVGEERQRRSYRFKTLPGWAVGSFFSPGRIGPLGPFSLFPFSFSIFISYFLFYFVSFANQFKSIQTIFKFFVNIHSRIPNQYETGFQGQNTILNRTSLISKEDLLA
jgi:hypothetical protein